ncbi:PopZ family protein [Salinarimonas soli]|uniref:DUF2497 domain-containing protein n=1 Tax=Salinarimonas soli TaxID=1638099 RepID=A0A5B2V984_9HYPH|nr:DUF2497 domain-containing protein [Salinarimonas soli]KAA2235135.1 DUF2497 domain-containing protein [Salinarimonas soli]
MEEILASIRRIISDDQESAKAPPPARAAPAPAPAPVEEDDEVLDLAMVAQPAPKAAPSLDIDHDDIAFRDEDPGQIDFDSIGLDDEPEPEPDFEPEPVAAFSPAPVPPAPPAPRAPEADFEDRLLSAATDASVSQAFNMLANTVLSNNARTLEDLVKEMLRPMLKAWLDDNLPTIVERQVRAEIERVARGGR